MAKGSEQLSWRWADGADRVCRDCGKEMRVLADISEVGTVNGRRFLRCNSCIRNGGYRAMLKIAQARVS